MLPDGEEIMSKRNSSFWHSTG